MTDAIARDELEKGARSANHGMKLVIGVLFVTIGIGAVVAGLNTTGGTPFLVAGFVIGALFVVLGVVSVLLAHPVALGGVSIRVEPDPVQRGAPLNVTVEHGGGGGLEAGLVGARIVRHQAGGGDQTVVWERTELLHEEWQPVGTGSPAQLGFDVPGDVTPTFETDGRRTHWSVVVRRSPGALAPRARQVIEVHK